MSARAWHGGVPDTDMYTYTVKPDGERVWCIAVGSFWYVARKTRSMEIIGWWHQANITRNPGYANVVVDAEMVMSGHMIFIDMLTSSTGEHAPIRRSLDWALEQFRALPSGHNIEIRKYWRNYADAVTYSKTVPYPSDGVVGIMDGSTEILKIKTERSMELRHAGDGSYEDGDGGVVLVCQGASHFQVGSIVEFRFRATGGSGTLVVSEVFVRPDKSVANGADACRNIITSSLNIASGSDSERRVALLWCNVLRDNLVRRALEIRSTGRVVLDVGTGTGQSLDAMTTMDTTNSYLLIERDASRCSAIQKRLRLKRLFRSPEDALSSIRTLVQGAKDHVLINCEFKTLLESQQVMKLLEGKIRCVTCIFSAQFIIADLQLVRMIGVPIIGCCYTYDDVSDDGVLVDT